MPRPPRVTQEKVAVAAFDIVRDDGEESLTARSLAEKLGCSVKPIFGLFDTMDEVRQAVWERANAWYLERLDAAMSAGDRPPYLASGLAYIEFARTEPNLFTLLFMHRRTPEQMEQSGIQLRPVIELIARRLGVGYDEAYAFHMRMWVYVHGIASMIVTGYLDWDETFTERSLSDMFHALSEYTETKQGE